MDCVLRQCDAVCAPAPSTRKTVLHILALLLQPVAVAPQSALTPAGVAAERIDLLWDVMLWTSLPISALTFAALAWALFRRRRPDELPPEADRPADPRGERANEERGGRGRTDTGRPRSERLGVRWMIGAGVVFPVVVLTALLLVTLPTLGALTPGREASGRAAGGDAAATIEVTGRQWWWEVRYLDDEPSRIVMTANELHVPVGRRVRVLLRTDDVIHSFWVPGLHGKTDMIPGRTNVMWLQADSAGVYRGQCAEFCGVQHAKMAFVVVADPPAEYERWLARQREPAALPATAAGVRAQEAFLQSGCVVCHTVRGTPARGSVGPDLTHLASRRTLAAGVLPLNLGNLHGWIADPQSLKPGSHMPAIPMGAEELHLIASYLAGLR